jgi:DNA-binding NtrC family response regulator
MGGVRELAPRAALLSTPVFIYGPTGSGKEILARHIHRISRRKRGPFFKINCGIEPERFEAELFGFVEGAFPGATASKPGLLELAHEGVLLIDDLSELGLPLQDRLLSVLQNGTFTPIGGRQPQNTSVRIMSTANGPLEIKVEEGCFRCELVAKLSSVTLCMPALRDRIDDLPDIARYLLSRFADMLGSRIRPLPPAATRLLMKYEWPGNIRELENVLFDYALNKVLLAPGSSLDSGGSEAASVDVLQPDRMGMKVLLGHHAALADSEFVLQPHNGNGDA